MAEIITIARPYAEAVFSLARAQGTLARWSETLAALASLAQNKEVAALVANPKLTSEQVQALLLEFLGGSLSGEETNFLALVLQNRRFAALPEVAMLFEVLKANAENELTVQVESAFPLDDAQTRDLTTTLSQQLARKITADVSVNPELIGGVKITVGDLVIDATLRGKLSALATSLKS